MISKITLLLDVLPKLGCSNVAYMVWYRLSMKLGIRKLMFPAGVPIKGLFFAPTPNISGYPEEWKPNLRQTADAIVNGRITWFSYHEFEVGRIPNWFKNPFSGEVIANPSKHWTELSDFDLNIGDIKIIWDPSRFDWLTHLARACRVLGNGTYLETLNLWLNDWSEKNPLNIGPNWKCGQETSIRVMKLMSAAKVLDQFEAPSEPLQQLVFHHLSRIAGNIRYAVAQDNNHGTSEAASLHIGAAWLLQNGTFPSKGKERLLKWQQLGQRIWNDRLLRLVGRDGTFSQRSVTYHRVVVDTVSFVLFFGEELKIPRHSGEVLKKIEALIAWQVKFIIPDNGESPNIGSNDGAMFENLHSCDYRDFRPSAQLAHWLCFGHKVFVSGDWDEVLFWRAPHSWTEISFIKANRADLVVLDREFLVMKNHDVSVFLKIPHDRFRPSANDAFHLDVWKDGKGLLIDSGSYSYNSREAFVGRFKSVEGHNTAAFGGQEQMPKLGRFMYARWISARDSGHGGHAVDGNSVKWSGAYSDAWGNVHTRSLTLFRSGHLEIVDEVMTNEPHVLRFNLDPICKYSIEQTGDYDFQIGPISVSGAVKIEFERGYSSIYYMQYDLTDTILVTPPQGGTVITRIDLTPTR